MALLPQYIQILVSFILMVSLTACGSTQVSGQADEGEERQIFFYTTQVQYTGENESIAKYLEIAQRSAQLIPLLEEHVGAFVMDAYNYQEIDDDGTPLYTMNTLEYPQEINPYAQSIRVSKNYFKYNPIAAVDGSDLIDQIIYDDLVLNILVPEQYRDMEEEILEAYRECFYFEKVQVANDYNQEAGLEERLELSKEDLNVNIIYVKDGQSYFTFRSDCASASGNRIQDPIVQIYTSNIHCNYAHSFMSQWLYFYSNKDSTEEAYQAILPYIQQCGAEDSVRKVVPVENGNGSLLG